MIRAASGAGTGRSVRRALLYGVGGATSTAVVGFGVYAYTTEGGRGIRRQALFWSRLLPVVGNYYWNLGSKSPYVKYLDWKREDLGDEEKAELRRQRISQLHEAHAPTIFQTLLDLKGLYIKLGQVLSVSALPVPDAYKVLFRTLQSNVPGHEPIDVIQRVLEKEWGKPIHEVLESIDDVPIGAASIGQAHKAKLRHSAHSSSDTGGGDDKTIIIKVQYPDASWQVPADIQCVGDFMKLCVYAGVVDESAANMSYTEFARQFMAELEYEREANNLREIHKSSLDPNGPYQKWGVVLPRVIDELCTNKIVTMSYLPGPKLEEEARRQLAALGIDTSKGMREMIQQQRNKATNSTSTANPTNSNISGENDQGFQTNMGWKGKLAQRIGKLVGLDGILWTVRAAKRTWLQTTKMTVRSIQLSSKVLPLPSGLNQWAASKELFLEQSERLKWTREWIKALMDVHGHQIFQLGLFNADPHPGNILVIDQPSELNERQKLGLIDFGQCKRLSPKEQYEVANLILKVVDHGSDKEVADAFRDLGVGTKNDNSEFLAAMARLMFGPLQPYHMDHDWHHKLNKKDRITYFPNQLSMVYRTSMLLRGLAVSLQENVSVGDMWQEHARKAVASYKESSTYRLSDTMKQSQSNNLQNIGLSRRYTTNDMLDDLKKLPS